MLQIIIERMLRQKFIFWVMTSLEFITILFCFYDILIHDIFEGCDILRIIVFDS